MKKLLLGITLLLIATAGFSQSFFKAVPKLEQRKRYGLSLVKDSMMNSFRPITNIAAYSVPGNILMAGAGISYQHLKWDQSTEKWKAVYSVSAMGWAGGSVAPKTPSDIISYGLMVGLFNNLLMFGPAYNNGVTGSHWQAVVGLGINLNN